MLLNNKYIIEEVKKETKMCKETNDNENMTTHSQWDSVKMVLRGKFRAYKPNSRHKTNIK